MKDDERFTCISGRPHREDCGCIFCRMARYGPPTTYRFPIIRKPFPKIDVRPPKECGTKDVKVDIE